MRDTMDILKIRSKSGMTVKSILFVLIGSILISCATSGDRDFPLAGRTYLSVSEAHGVQIEYLGFEDAWLWYPGNTRVVRGKWRVGAGQRAFICWTYEENSRNPVTRQAGSQEGCELLSQSAARVQQSLSGDVFNLRSGAIPFRRKKCDVPAPFASLPANLC